jgi:hypothetical protein
MTENRANQITLAAGFKNCKDDRGIQLPQGSSPEPFLAGKTFVIGWRARMGVWEIPHSRGNPSGSDEQFRRGFSLQSRENIPVFLHHGRGIFPGVRGNSAGSRFFLADPAGAPAWRSYLKTKRPEK